MNIRTHEYFCMFTACLCIYVRYGTHNICAFTGQLSTSCGCGGSVVVVMVMSSWWCLGGGGDSGGNGGGGGDGGGCGDGESGDGDGGSSVLIVVAR